MVDRFLTGLAQADATADAEGTTAITHPILARAEVLALGGDRLREVADRLRDEVVLPRRSDAACHPRRGPRSTLHDRAFEELDGRELIARPYEESGALLLGRDLRARYDDTSRERLAAIVRRAAHRVPSLSSMLRASSSERSDDLLKRFHSLEAGLLAMDG